MHDDLKALLVAGWSFGLRYDAATEAVWATAKLGDEVRRAAAAWPIEAISRVMLEVQKYEANK